jgi:DNA repair protein RecO (recombination protein O)
MEWQDIGLVIATRRHGERDAILEVMTPGHGRHLGMVRGGRSSRQTPTLQPGNRVALVWRARLEDHLGQFTAEVLESRAGVVLSDPLALHAVTHLGMLMRLLPERSPHPAVFEAGDAICCFLAKPEILGPVLIRFEIMILSELGFGLDLSECALTGGSDNLVYVSPKSGRAVSREAGAPWAEKLLPLPPFLAENAGITTVAAGEIADGFRLAGHFLDRHVFAPRGIASPTARAEVMRELLARLAPPAT